MVWTTLKEAWTTSKKSSSTINWVSVAELETQMQAIVESYQCEWKTTIENPEKLKRFRTFVNSDKTDNSIVFVEERDQIRPATEQEIQFKKVV